MYDGRIPDAYRHLYLSNVPGEPDDTARANPSPARDIPLARSSGTYSPYECGTRYLAKSARNRGQDRDGGEAVLARCRERKRDNRTRRRAGGRSGSPAGPDWDVKIAESQRPAQIALAGLSRSSLWSTASKLPLHLPEGLAPCYAKRVVHNIHPLGLEAHRLHGSNLPLRPGGGGAIRI
mgnify:CR=1 FL=1